MPTEDDLRAARAISWAALALHSNCSSPLVQLQKTVFVMKFAANSNIDAVYDFMNVVVYERLAALCNLLLDNGNVAAAHLELSSAWVVAWGSARGTSWPKYKWQRVTSRRSWKPPPRRGS